MPPPWPSTPPTAAHRAMYRDARVRPFWLDDLPEREPLPPLREDVRADLCVVGGGYTGLWAALRALEQGRSVVVLEARRCGDGASGRNGGFLSSSLTHGLGHGEERFTDELPVLERLGRENFDGLVADLDRHGIDAELERDGELMVALEPHQLEWLDDEAALLRRHGHDAERLDAAATRALVDSPTYLGGVVDRTGAGVLHPGRLADGLRRAALEAGARVYEYSRATRMRAEGDGVAVSTPGGVVRADRLVLATSAYPSLVRAVRRYVAPVYDYVLVTEPLGDAVHWPLGGGAADLTNRFHYYRMTADRRLVFGGYEAVYTYGGRVTDARDDDDAVFSVLAQHVVTTFPQLAGARFTHRCGGAIDTCSRFVVFFGTALAGRAVYAAGYTGLGVGASRWGAHTALDLLDGRDTEATRLDFVRSRPVPFPPEPLRSAVISLTRRELARADERQGRRGLWLRTLDAVGLGFDS